MTKAQKNQPVQAWRAAEEGVRPTRDRFLNFISRCECAEKQTDGYLYNTMMNELIQEHPAQDKAALLEAYWADSFIGKRPFYFAILSVKKALYYHRFGIGAVEYLAICLKIVRAIDEIFADALCEYAPFLLNYDQTKQIGVYFSSSYAQVLTIAERVNDAVQQILEQETGMGLGGFACQTALAGPMHTIDETFDSYMQARELSNLSFFRMEPTVLTKGRLTELRRPVEYREVMECCRLLLGALAQGQGESCRAFADRLFLRLLKDSFSPSLVRDALSYLRYESQIIATVYDVQGDADQEALFEIRSYLSIEECHAALMPFWDALCEAIALDKRYCAYVMSAIYYIKRHYADSSLSISDVADYARVTPTHLSRLFRAQTGSSPVEYIKRYRLKAACRMLDGMELKVYAVAEAVGIPDVRYFTRLFKQEYGCTPQKYRDEAQFKPE